MVNRAKAKGSAFERDVVAFLNAHGFPHAERRALRGINDAGDIAGVIGWCLELKNHREMDLGTWATEAQKESIAARCHRWAVVHKRRGKGVRDAYVTLPLWLFASMVGIGGESGDEG